MSFIYIDDLLSILRSLPKKGNTGQTYIVCDDEAVTSKDFYGYMARKLGVKAPSHRSAPLTKLMASAFNSLGRLAGTPPIITHEAIKVLLSSRRLSNSNMKSALGITLSYPTYRDGLNKIFGKGSAIS
jgi:nucleoside-diphosphate-sugar epimerase